MSNDTKVKKEPLKTRDPYKYNKRLYAGLKAGKWSAISMPFIVIFCAKFNEYIEIYDGQQWKLTIGCIIAILVAIISAYQEIKKAEAPSSPITTAVGWGIAFMISYLFYAIISDLTLVLGCEFAGQCIACGMEIASEKSKKYLVAYENAKVNAEANAQVQREAIAKDNGTRI